MKNRAELDEFAEGRKSVMKVDLGVDLLELLNGFSFGEKRE